MRFITIIFYLFQEVWRSWRDSDSRIDFSTYSLSRGAPYSHLGTTPNKAPTSEEHSLQSACFSQRKQIKHNQDPHKREHNKWGTLAASVRFELTVDSSPITNFQDWLLKPLGQLAILIIFPMYSCRIFIS